MTGPGQQGLSSSGNLSKLTPEKLSALIGDVTGLMMASKVHRLLQVRDIADIMLPALNLGQYRIYRNKKKQAIALVTWAQFSPEVEQSYLGGNFLLSEADRTSGDIIYFTDFIAPYGHTRLVVKDLRHNVFPHAMPKALRFLEQGKTRPKVWQLHGVNYRKPLQ
jgi:cytolysin-activating lysine-acyltransferase